MNGLFAEAMPTGLCRVVSGMTMTMIRSSLASSSPCCLGRGAKSRANPTKLDK